METNETSEFGMGFVYNLVLFAKHWAFMKFNDSETNRMARTAWFNGASDHLYDMQIPEDIPNNLRNTIADWIDRVIERGHGGRIGVGHGMTNDEIENEISDCFDELEEICREIDIWLKVKSVKADYQ